MFFVTKRLIKPFFTTFLKFFDILTNFLLRKLLFWVNLYEKIKQIKHFLFCFMGFVLFCLILKCFVLFCLKIKVFRFVLFNFRKTKRNKTKQNTNKRK
jgi:hypothetical protein